MSDIVCNKSAHMPTEIVSRWAAHVAERFDVSNPGSSLARSGIGLHVSQAPVRALGKVVYGTWDPLLRRVEVFACHEGRSDEDVVATLAHEVWHMMEDARRELAGQPITPDRDEQAAETFASAWVRQLGPNAVRKCAAALRAQAGIGAALQCHTNLGALGIGE